MEVINTQNQPEGLNAINTDVVMGETPQKKTGFLKILIILFFVLLFFSALFYFLFYKKDSALEKEETVLEQPEGEIYLTLSLRGTNKENIYKLDVESMELEEYFPDSPYANLMASFSANLEEIVFVRRYDDESGQVLIFNESEEKFVELTPRLQTFPQNPKFSPDMEKVVYWVYEPNEGLSGGFYGQEPSDHNIYMVLINGGEPQKVAEGLFPVFFSENEILYWKNEGIYLLNLSTLKEFYVFDFDMERFTEFEDEILAKQHRDDVKMWWTMRFNLSRDGKSVIVSDTFASSVFVDRIEEMRVFEDALSYDSKRVFTWTFPGPNWPVFSPEGKYFTIQEFDDLSDPFSSVVHVFGLESLETEALLELGGFEANAIWITDWIVR